MSDSFGWDDTAKENPWAEEQKAEEVVVVEERMTSKQMKDRKLKQTTGFLLVASLIIGIGQKIYETWMQE